MGFARGREEMRNTFPLLEKGKSRIFQDPVKSYLLALSLIEAGSKPAPKIPMLVHAGTKPLRRGGQKNKADLVPGVKQH